MSGKWTDRGIECGHNPPHLVADKEGVVVCTRRKPREEIPVGRMILEESQLPATTFEYVPVGTDFLKQLERPPHPSDFQDEELHRAFKELGKANAVVCGAQRRAQEKLELLKARFLAVIYEKGLAAPTLEALHDARFACPQHPQARFLWQKQPYLKKFPETFYLLCSECGYGTVPISGVQRAYSCNNCGIVLGIMNQSEHNFGHTTYRCVLCGTKVGEYHVLD